MSMKTSRQLFFERLREAENARELWYERAVDRLDSNLEKFGHQSQYDSACDALKEEFFRMEEEFFAPLLKFLTKEVAE
jgi:hypothetical protein